MKLRVKKSTTLVSLCLSALVLFAGIGMFLFSSRPTHAQSQGGRLITVYDRGSAHAFITTKSTLKEALDDQGVQLDEKDAVEPALEEKLVAPDYKVNIYRARPVTVIDGATRQKIVTPYQTAERIVKGAGITLYPEDTTQLERSMDFVADGAGLQLRITRATPITIDLYGKQTEIRTQAKTVGEMLKEKNISLGDSGRVSVPATTPIEKGMQLRVWREGRQTITSDEEVAFTTDQIKDADREVGYKQVQTPGQNGRKTVTYEILVQNGAEVSRTEIASVETQAPVKQVEVIGSKPKSLAYTGGGSKSDWLAASNIPRDAWGYADFMVQKESGWNPNSVNRSSGACGLAQALPCSKLGPNWSNPVVSLNWMDGYVNGRYGGWEGAYTFWQKNRWY